MNETKAELPHSLSNADGSVTVKLSEPIQFGEETIESLRIKRPKVKHIKKLKMKDLSAEDMLVLISAVSGQFPQALDEMSIRDFTFCAEVIGDFLDDSKALKTL